MICNVKTSTAPDYGTRTWHGSESIATKVCSQTGGKWNAMFESHVVTSVDRTSFDFLFEDCRVLLWADSAAGLGPAWTEPRPAWTEKESLWMLRRCSQNDCCIEQVAAAAPHTGAAYQAPQADTQSEQAWGSADVIICDNDVITV